MPGKKRVRRTGWAKGAIRLSRTIFCAVKSLDAAEVELVRGQRRNSGCSPMGYVRLGLDGVVQVSQAVCDTDHSGR